uniref:Uncharacterized protein n=1 Tax=Rhizophora mucronata TaxID=61149 RepID=A0A2P2IT87_RHIMU
MEMNPCLCFMKIRRHCQTSRGTGALSSKSIGYDCNTVWGPERDSFLEAALLRPLSNSSREV